MFSKMFLLTLCTLSANLLPAQFKKTVLPATAFNNALEKIVVDFRYNFKNIKGETVVNQGEYDTYSSTVILPGASNCIIYGSHSVEDTTASWQGVFYKGDDYKAAITAYKNVYRLISKSKLELIDVSTVGFAGIYEAPTDDVRFTVSSLRLDVLHPQYKRFLAEIELITNYEGWQVNINFYNRKPDDERE